MTGTSEALILVALSIQLASSWVIISGDAVILPRIIVTNDSAVLPGIMLDEEQVFHQCDMVGEAKISYHYTTLIYY